MKILISGAGIAGLTAAYWLCKFGFEVTVIEVAAKLRDEGYLIDFHSEGRQLARVMGIEKALDAKSEFLDKIEFLGSKNQLISEFKIKDIAGFFGKDDTKYMPIMRGDLEQLLFEALPSSVQVVFDESIASVKNTDQKVDIEFKSGKKESFDLLVGADGIHSKTREMIFGDESQFLHSLGSYIFIARLKGIGLDLGHSVKMQIDVDSYTYAIPTPNGEVITIIGLTTDQSLDVLREKGRQILAQHFEGSDTLASKIIPHISDDVFLFVDEVAQVRMKDWCSGRVALIGDAASCPTLLSGQGALMAVTQAYVLAKELQNSKDDIGLALERYQAIMQPVLEEKMRDGRKVSGFFLPKNKLQKKWINFVFGLMRHKFFIRLFLSQFLKPTIFDKKYPLD